MKRELKNKVKAKYNNQCYLCGKSAETLHHIIPKSLGGKDTMWNLVPLCEECAKRIHKLIDPLIKLIQATRN